MIIYPFIILASLFILGVPVAYCLIIASLPYFMQQSDSLPLMMIIQRLVANAGNTTLQAIPYFIVCGIIMNYAGITKRLMNLADCLVGFMPGGLGEVNVLLSAMMGGMSGSCAADAATQCKILVPEMTNHGYDIEFSAAVTAASSLITPIIPPGIALIMYGYLTETSIAQMFAAGYMPGILTTVLMMILVYIISKKRGYKGSRTRIAGGKELLRACYEGVWGLFIPFGIVLGLRFGVFAPTEAGALCCLYSFLVGLIIYRSIRVKDLYPMLLEGVTGTCSVMFLMCAANVLAFYLSWERIPHMFSEVLISLTNNKYVFLIVVNVAFLIMGMFLEGGASMTILAPILAPVAAALGIDLVHFGIIMVFNITIGCITPPFGIILFLVAPLLNLDVRRVIKEIWPFIGVFIIVLILITFWEDLALLIPRWMAGK